MEKNKTNNWSAEFGANALDRAGQELRAFPLQEKSDRTKRQRMAEAALGIGWTVVAKVGALFEPDLNILDGDTVSECRDDIKQVLKDVINMQYPDDVILGDDILHWLGFGLGERQDHPELFPIMQPLGPGGKKEPPPTCDPP